MNKIHHNVKSVGSMVHIQPKCVLDDVVVPPSQEQSSSNDLSSSFSFANSVNPTPCVSTTVSTVGDNDFLTQEAEDKMTTESDFFVHDLPMASSTERPTSRQFRGASTLEKGLSTFASVSSFGDEFGDDLKKHRKS